ncbi:hypothetical protein GCM10023231_02130 [Olivibacter ginsenosidimutans]|uniref:DUF4202 domain-containing protein n=1 Tax=Olivibacter ginsenosidimutans TaxID=1176537 RepID=A0ABP9AE21_9SPHI
MNTKLQQAFERFDQYNQQDPNALIWEEKTYPQEYFLALKLHDWVLRLKPDANEALRLASRSQHIGRWKIARKDYPAGREGYLKWRKELANFHADKSASILQEVGYSEEIIQKVRSIILKKRIKVDQDVQTMENALCLVFLAYQYETFYPKYRTKIVTILKKSLLKMDSHGHQFALALPYSEEGLQYIKEALRLIQS